MGSFIQTIQKYIGCRIMPLSCGKPIGMMLASFLLALAVGAFGCGTVQAQVAPLLKSDINTSATGSYSYAAPTYTLSGAGAGIGTAGSGAPGNTTDGFTFASVPVTGNVEIVGKLTGQSGSGLSPYAQAGLMIRSTLAADSQMFFVGASPASGNGVNFHARSASGAKSVSTLGAAPGAAPIWLRLVVSGQNIAAYRSGDATNWILVGQAKATLPGTFRVGLAVSSNQASTLSTATFENLRVFTNVPQRNTHMLLWLRSDAGLQSDAAGVQRWVDQSAYGNDALAAGAPPAVAAAAIEGAPVVDFNGTSQNLKLPTGFKDFTQGMTMFVVAKPSASSTGRFVDFYSGTAGDAFFLKQMASDRFGLWIKDPPFGDTYVDGTGMSNSTFQLLEATDINIDSPYYSRGSVYLNGARLNSHTAVEKITVINRTNNTVGSSGTSSDFFGGKIAEILLYDSLLSDSERQRVERYFNSKYGFGSTGLSAPSISPANRVLAGSQAEVTITGDSGNVLIYTTDGTTPDLTSATTSVYGAPFNISTGNVTIKARSIDSGNVAGPIATVQLQVDPNASIVYKDGLKFWLRGDNGVILNGSNVAKWLDVSGNNISFEQTTSASQPSFLSNQVNGLPAIGFDGTQRLKNTTNLNAWTGASIFMVLNPLDASPSSSPRLLDFGNGTDVIENFGISQSAADDWGYFAYQSIYISNCTYTNGWTRGSFQLIDSVHSNADALASVFKNGTLGNQVGSFPTLPNVTRTSNSIGASSSGAYYSKFNLAELIVYNRPLSAAERKDIEGYLLQRYHLAVSAPIINPSGGMHAPLAVTLATDVGAQAYYTTDGSAPSYPPGGSTRTYAGPFGISKPTQVRAIARNFSTNSSEAQAAYIGIDPGSPAVPQNGLKTWLRSDVGVVPATAPAIASWVDLTGAHTPTATSPNQPTLVANALGGTPAVNFSQSPTAQVMTLPGSFNFANGLSAFVIANIGTPASTADMLTFSDGTKSVNFTITAGGDLRFSTFNTATQSLSSPGGSLTLGVPQLFEVVQDSAGTATLLRNGEQLASGSVADSTASALNINQISNALSGQYFEMPLFDRAVSAAERRAIEAYLLNHLGLQSAPLTDPVFSITPPVTFNAPTAVSISAPLNSVVRFTTDNTAVTASSPILRGPINVSHTQTIRARAFLNNIESAEVTGTFTVDADSFPAPGSGTSAPSQNLQLPAGGQ